MCLIASRFVKLDIAAVVHSYFAPNHTFADTRGTCVSSLLALPRYLQPIVRHNNLEGSERLYWLNRQRIRSDVA